MTATSGLEARTALLRAAVDEAWGLVRAAVASEEAFPIAAKADAADLVTPVDRSVEARVRELVLDRFPHDAFAGEEFGRVHDGAPWRWWVDPVDGTMNFAHRLPHASISVALEHEGRTVAGAVVHAFTGARFEAVRGEGAYLDGRRLRVDPEVGLAGGIVVTELLNAHPWPGFGQALEALAERHATLRVMGSTALSLAYTAAGAASACVMRQPSLIDAAAGLLLVEEAGGALSWRDARAGAPLPMLVAGGRRAVVALERELDRIVAGPAGAGPSGAPSPAPDAMP